MKQFDMTRFGRVMKLDFAEGRKAMMWGALCMLLLYLFFFWFAHMIGFHSSAFDYINNPEEALRKRMNAICESVGVFAAMAMYIFFLITASTLYRGEQKKQLRIAWLMLPATNLEKFLSRWLYMLSFSIVGGILMFFIADLIHTAYLWKTGNPVMSATDDFFLLWPHVDKFRTLTHAITGWSILVSIHSFFLLSGVFFKKFHFIAASAIFVLLFTTIVAMMNAIGYRDTPSTASTFDARIILNCMLVCLTVLFTWLSYRLFCRWQVVTHKFANV